MAAVATALCQDTAADGDAAQGLSCCVQSTTSSTSRGSSKGDTENQPSSRPFDSRIEG